MKFSTVSCLLSGIYVLLSSCSSTPEPTARLASSFPDVARGTPVQAQVPSAAAAAPVNRKAVTKRINLIKDLIPRGTHARKTIRPMRPRFITIHSTQNFSEGADALRHSLALKRGKLRSSKRAGGNRIGYLSWHFSVDERRAVQHLPTNEQGEHADYDGPGNNYSIGIEMCENRGNSRSATLERTALLTALLMRDHNIPLSGIVPHYHWPRWDKNPAHKNCPHYLLDNGRPGPKWDWFKAKVNAYYQQISGAA